MNDTSSWGYMGSNCIAVKFARSLIDCSDDNQSIDICPRYMSFLHVGKAPFNSLLESIRSAQKTEFEKMCAEKDAEVQDLNNPPSLQLLHFIQNMHKMAN